MMKRKLRRRRLALLLLLGSGCSGQPRPEPEAPAQVQVSPQVVEPPVPVHALPVADTEEDLSIRADVQILAPDTVTRVRALTTIHNTSNQWLRLEWGKGNCSFRLQAYRRAEPVGRPVWDSWLWRLQRNRPLQSNRPYSVGCEGMLAQRPLAPGDSIRPELYQWEGTVSDILGDSLPPGQYHFRAVLVEFNRDTVLVRAGALQLAK
jgi:hypothetical protein